MKFDLTNRLKANENPVITIGDIELTVKADAGTVLQIMSVISEGVNMNVLNEAKKLLFSKEDIKKLDSFMMYNWTEIVQAAITLAVDGDLEEEKSPK